MLALITRRSGPSEIDNLSKYISMAVEELNYIVRCRRIWDDDVFSANLLGWLSYSTCSHETNAHIHFNGSVAMLSYRMERRLRRSELLETFGPFVIDCASTWATRNGAIPLRCTTFEQRVKYFDEFYCVDTAGTWYSGVLEAGNATLGNLIELSLRTVCTVTQNEQEGTFIRNGVAEVLGYVKAELGDSKLHKGLQTIYQSFQGTQTNHHTVEGQLITRVFHRLRCVLLLLTILEAPSVQIGVSCPKAQYLARIIVSFCRKQSIRRDGEITDYYLLSWHNFSHLLLGGMALAKEVHPECKDH